MSSLKSRFPAYSRALHLYPRAYLRQYGVQTMQTLADILDDPDVSRTTKTKLHLGAWVDLGRSIPRQRLLAAIRSAAYQPQSYFRNRSIVSLLLITPLLLTTVSPNLFSSRTSARVCLVILPLIATLNALYALAIWFAARQKWPKSKRPASNGWGTRLSLVGLLLIGLAGMAFLGLIATANYMSTRRTHHARDVSMAYQAAHPTLACTILPLDSARLIASSKTLYLNNDDYRNVVPYSGMLGDSNGIRRTSCTYQNVDLSKYGIAVETREAFSPTAQQNMYSDFSDQPITDAGYNWQPSSLQNYQGFYGQGPSDFDLSLWVKNYWLKVSAPSLEAATATMQIMIGNLDKELAAQAAAKPAVSARQIVPLTAATLSLSSNDQTRLEYAIMGKDIHVAAGTEFHANVTALAGNQATGTFIYGNGIHGTFVAQKNHDSWSIIGYREYKK
jgi:hypothetical protein